MIVPRLRDNFIFTPYEAWYGGGINMTPYVVGDQRKKTEKMNGLVDKHVPNLFLEVRS